MMRGSYPDGPRLLADIGGTNVRFALEYAPGRIAAMQTFPSADFARFQAAARAYLDGFGAGARHAVIAIANPGNGDAIKMTNHDWAFSIEGARRELGLDTLLVVNDFTALAMSLPKLTANDLLRIGGGVARPGGVIGLVAAGTGLGVSGLVPAGDAWVALESKGSHVAFSPSDPREVAVLDYLWQRYADVSAERIVSGPGIALIREALAASGGEQADLSLSTAAIVEKGLAESDSLCRETLDCFCGMLGTVAANLAVTLGATGGVYIGGGVVARLGAYFGASPFRARFESNGQFSAFTAGIATMLITAPYPALAGAAAVLTQHLGSATSATFVPRQARVTDPEMDIDHASH